MIFGSFQKLETIPSVYLSPWQSLNGIHILSEDGKTLLRALKKNPKRKLKNQLNVLRAQVLKDDVVSTLRLVTVQTCKYVTVLDVP